MHKIECYFSHPIRGTHTNPTFKEETINNKRAILFVERLRTEFPQLNIYCPAENSDFDLGLRQEGVLMPTLLLADCKILEQKELFLAFTWCKSRGMEKELSHAKACGIPIISFSSYSEAQSLIRSFLWSPK